MAQRQFRSDDTDKWIYGFGDGSDGSLTISANTTEAPIDSSCSGTSGQTSLTATNASFAAGQLILIHQTRGTGVGAWELNKIASYSAGTITTTHSLCNTYTDSGASQAQVRVMKQYTDVTINNGITYTAKAWNGDVGGIMAFFAKGTISGVTSGIINLNGNAGSGQSRVAGIGYVGGDGNPTVEGIGYRGEGTGGAGGDQSTSANGNGGGGGNATGGTAGGGGGGNATAGTNGGGQNQGGTGGSSSGNASLTVMTFGGGGGGANTWSSPDADAGGSGGAILLMIAANIDLTSLTINNKGGNSGDNGYGGGGAGGSILFKAKTFTGGTNKALATGGTTNGTGGAGSAGRIHLDYKTSYTGTTNPTLDVTQDSTIDTTTSSTASFLYNFL